MSVNNKRRRVKMGDIFAIDLGGNKYGYCRLLKSPLMEFYDFQSNSIVEDLSIILNNNIIFKVWVIKYAFKSENWHYIGNFELKMSLRREFYSSSKIILIILFLFITVRIIKV